MAAQLFDAMVLTLFFKDANNMGLSHCTRLQLAVEGITELENFKEFNNNGMMAIAWLLLRWYVVVLTMKVAWLEPSTITPF